MRGLSGRSMLAMPPPAPYSNDLNSGPSSSQFASRRVGGAAGAGRSRSGSRNGFASTRALTDGGTTWRSCSLARAGSSGSGSGSSSTTISTPPSNSMCLRMARAVSESLASGSSSGSTEVSRAAVRARMLAMPSRRFSVSARSGSLSGVAGSFACVRSSRISTAMTWNFVRLTGLSLPRWAACSISRTARASTGMSPSLSIVRVRAEDRRWPVRAMQLLVHCRGQALPALPDRKDVSPSRTVTRAVGRWRGDLPRATGVPGRGWDVGPPPAPGRLGEDGHTEEFRARGRRCAPVCAVRLCPARSPWAARPRVDA